MDNIEVICIGAAIVGIPLRPMNKNIFNVDSYPLERIAMTTGGDAINKAMIISRLDHHTALMSWIGSDAADYLIIDHCHRENIDIKSLEQDTDIDTSINVDLVIADGERTFVISRNGSLWELDMNGADSDRFSQAELLSLASIFNSPLLDGQTLMNIFTQAKMHGSTIYADMIKLRFSETLNDIREALNYVDHLFPNFEEARLLVGEDTLDEIADGFLDCGMKTVVIKTGKRDCFIKRVGMKMVVPAVSGITAIDAIGAGGSFASGFTFALLEGRPFRDCALFASATAAISVLSVGAMTGAKNRKLVEQLLGEYEG